jgi:hypothetical protein
MHHLDIWETINAAVHDALLDEVHTLGEAELLRRADALLLGLPSVSGSPPTAALLLRRHRAALQKELCAGRVPRPLPDVIEDEVRELTRAVMVSVDVSEGFSVEAAVLLALAIRAGGLERLCELPATGSS